MADTPTPHYEFILQQPGTNPKTWGGKLNANWASIDSLLFTATTDASTAVGQAATALQRAGGTMTGDIALANVGPGSVYSVGFRGAPVVEFSADKTLALTDAGCSQRMVGTTALNLTIPPVGTVGFPLGTVIPLRNSTGVAMNILRGAGVTLTVVGSATNANATVAARGAGAIWQEATNVWLIQGSGVS